MLTSSNLTHEEFFRLNGTLTQERIEELLDAASAALDPGTVAAHVLEARASFPSEDCLSEVLKGLGELAKKIRGANRDACNELFEKLDSLANQINQSTEYGAEELTKALQYIGITR